MKIRLLMFLALCAWAASAEGASSGEASTEGAIAQKLLERLFQPVLATLAGEPSVTAVAIRRPAVPGTFAGLYEEVGNFLYDRGYEIFTLDPQMSTPDGSVVLHFEVEAAGFDYPREKGGFLGLGRSRLLRRGALGVSGRLEDPADGRWLWRGSPLVQHEQWIYKRERDALAKTRPAWMAGKPLPAFPPDRNWWERGLVAGLLAGVIVLYVDGTR